MRNTTRVLTICITLLGSSVRSFSVPYDTPTKIIVSGAAGKTGKLVFSKLEKNPAFIPVGVVRSEKSAKALLKDVKCDLEHLVIADVTTWNNETAVPSGLEGSKALVSLSMTFAFTT